MNPTYDFSGQVALVTGASSCMGLATARAYAAAGAAVVLTDINEAPLRAAAEELTGQGHQVLAVVCDVADEASVAAAVRAGVEAFGQLDHALNNAGIQAPTCDAADEPARSLAVVAGAAEGAAHGSSSCRSAGAGDVFDVACVVSRRRQAAAVRTLSDWLVQDEFGLPPSQNV